MKTIVVRCIKCRKVIRRQFLFCPYCGEKQPKPPGKASSHKKNKINYQTIYIYGNVTGNIIVGGESVNQNIQKVTTTSDIQEGMPRQGIPEELTGLIVNERQSLADLHQMIRTAKRLDVIGSALDNFLTDSYEEIIYRVINDELQIRVLVTNPESKSGKAAAERIPDFRESSDKTRKLIQSIIERLERADYILGGFGFRAIDFYPPASAVIAYTGDEETSAARVVFYNLNEVNHIGEGRLCLMFPMKTSPWFDHYARQFYQLWIQPEEVQAIFDETEDN